MRAHVLGTIGFTLKTLDLDDEMLVVQRARGVPHGRDEVGKERMRNALC